MPKTYDLITLGRISLDLFSEQIGAAFQTIESFSSSVGGSPTNVAIGSSRLGLKTAVLTALGNDKVAAFIRAYLAKEGVATDFVLTKQGRSGLAIVGVEPPQNFPLTFYRENPADIHLGIDDALRLPLEHTKALLVSGTAFATSPVREASILALERARTAQIKSFIDLDLRPDQWHDARAYGITMRSMLPLADVIIGTEEESYAALLETINERSSTIIKTLTTDQIVHLNKTLIDYLQNTQQIWLLKRGAKGVSIFSQMDVQDVAGFRANVVNTVGAGDAFASGLIYSYLQGWNWAQSARFANACGALVVSRHGCAAALPRLEEVQDFMAGGNGGV
jgi:5-dehydro-2-deoxygluconokinase